MPPLWGFDVFVYPYCYKHVAPLGLMMYLFIRIAINMPPLWDFDVFRCPVYYTHAAPLGLWVVVDPRVLYTCRPSGALMYFVVPYTIHMSPLWGFGVFGYPHCYKHIAPLGLWVVVDPRVLYTCRPSGALVTRTCRPSIHMPPLWG